MSLLMQLTDVAEKGRLEPMTGAINAGEILHLVGPNGAGKSTLLARMAGLTTGPGQITLLEHPLADWSPGSLAHRRSYLVQQQVPPFAMPVWHFLTLHQPDKARTDLLQEIADALGYANQNYFTRLFTKYFGESPRAYRNKYGSISFSGTEGE